MTTTSLFIHPELSPVSTSRERGVFEVEGFPGGFRLWYAYDSRGMIRILVGMQNRDVDAGLKARIEADLDRLEEQDRTEQEA